MLPVLDNENDVTRSGTYNHVVLWESCCILILSMLPLWQCEWTNFIRV